ncbi:hypothetical protein Tco_1545386, partial [Tanacetum coccineum]
MTSALIWQVSSGSSESGNATSLPALESSSSSESLATFAGTGSNWTEGRRNSIVLSDND